MKILCLIDSLGAGGAQRQLVTLAIGLKQRGHEIRFLTYHSHSHFLPLLQEACISCEVISVKGYWRRVLEIRKILRQDWQDVVLAFLEAPSLYAEFARIPKRRWGLVVGERIASPAMGRGVGRWMRGFHWFADAVVTNSYTSRLILERGWSFLTPRLATIYNCIDLENFCPVQVQRDDSATRIVVVASYDIRKNLSGVAKAMVELGKEPGAPNLVVDWYGGPPTERAAHEEVKQFIAKHGLAERLRLHPATSAISNKYTSASAVGLFSFFEGLPNAVCEGMACGRPIIMSNVCDAAALVQEGENGLLCDPHSPTSIADAIRRFLATDDDTRRKMGERSRSHAEKLFARDAILSRYEAILGAAARGEPLPSGCDWPETVPVSAQPTLAHWKATRRTDFPQK